MTNPANDIVRQANQGSVAAIIQVLNDKLADSGVRTRAILAEGVLQLLCEAATVDQLEPTTLVEQVRQILESLAPRNIRRVNINSRIVREQQILWLEEISRDPEAQLLWSKEITLKKPNLLQQFLNERRSEHKPAQSGLPTRSPRQLREQRQFWRGGIAGGATVALLLLIGGVLYAKLWAPRSAQSRLGTTEPISATANQINPTPATPPSTASPSPAVQPVADTDPFASAVRIAEQAARDGQRANTAGQWRGLATQWQHASELMASVPTSDRRYRTAQQKAVEYRQKSASVLQKSVQ